MSTTILSKESANKELFIYFLNSFLITNILFFIDEGFYDFRWMTNAGNWIIFFVYLSMIAGVQILFSQVILNRFIEQRKRITSVVLGTIFIISFLVLGLFTQ